MGPQRAVPQPQDLIDASSIHMLYGFPQNLSYATQNNYKNQLGWLYNRKFAIAPIIDWAWLHRVGMVMELERYWKNVFMGDGFTFACNGFNNLFSI